MMTCVDHAGNRPGTVGFQLHPGRDHKSVGLTFSLCRTAVSSVAPPLLQYASAQTRDTLAAQGQRLTSDRIQMHSEWDRCRRKGVLVGGGRSR